MNKLLNAFIVIIIGTVFVIVLNGGVTSYQFITNGWDINTRETVRGSGITYNELFYDYNEIQNYDFNAGITDWIGQNANISVTNNIMTVTATNPTSFAIQINVLNNDHIYYVNATLKPENLGASYNLWALGTQSTLLASANALSTTQWQTVSGVADARTNDGTFAIQYSDTIESGDKYYINGNYGVYVIDLTATFGAGNEPSKSSMDLWFHDFIELRMEPDQTLKTVNGLVTLLPVLFVIIVIAGAFIFIKTKQ